MQENCKKSFIFAIPNKQIIFMATIGFQLIGKKTFKSIYVQVTMDRKTQYKLNTGLKAKSDDWDKGFIKKQGEAERKVIRKALTNFKTELQEAINKAISNDVVIDKDFVKSFVDAKNNKFSDIDINLLRNLVSEYIKEKEKSNKINSRQKKVTRATLIKYRTIRTKIENYEKHHKKNILVKNVDSNFMISFVEYLSEIEKISINTIEKYFANIKTICFYGRDEHNIKVNKSLATLRVAKEEKTEIITLSFDELDRIRKAEMFSEALDNARDWLILGCYLGQRVSDLLTLTTDNIKQYKGMKIIELKQKKTKTVVKFPLPVEILPILEKYGSFPRRISDQIFNKHIKKVCKVAGITQEIQGSLMQETEIQGKKQYRKVKGLYPKYELVASHICRRSFATNYYGKIPTSLLRKITGHATEEMLITYIGETPDDTLKDINDYFNAIHKEREKAKAEKERLTIKQAN